MNYLVQKKWDSIDGICNTLMNADAVIDFIDSLDYAGNGFLLYTIYDISDIGNPRHIVYTGWQPMNKITLIYDDTEEIALEGYGTDH